MALPELIANSPIPGSDVPIVTLGAAITTTSQTTITVSAPAPSVLQAEGQFRIVVDSEIMLVTGGATTTTWTVERGTSLPSPDTCASATHLVNAGVFHFLTAGALSTFLTVGNSTLNQLPFSDGEGGFVWSLVGGRGAALTVAASNTPAAMQLSADVLCDGTADDVTIQTAAQELSSGEIKLLPGDYYHGTSATSYINVNNSIGGISIVGSGRRQSSIIHIPAGSSAPMAMRMATYGGGSHTVRDLEIIGDGPQSGSTVGIWMQCNEPQIHNCALSKVPGHAVIIDGAPLNSGSSPTAPSQKTFSGNVTGTEVVQAGIGILAAGGAGVPGDAFVVTTLNENTVFSPGCFVDGGNGNASGLLQATLTASTQYTSITVSAITNAMSSGDQLVIVDAGAGPPEVTQIAILTQPAVINATTLTVAAFTPTHTFTAGVNCFVADNTLMITRKGWAIKGTCHLDDCHPYFCYMFGAESYECGMQVVGGEFETNGYINIRALGSTIVEAGGLVGIPTEQTLIQGIICYGNPCYAHIYTIFLYGGVVKGNVVDGGSSNIGIYGQSLSYSAIEGNTVFNAMTPIGNQSACISVINSNNTNIQQNVCYNNEAITGTHYYGVSVFNSTNCNITGNNVSGVTGSGATPLNAGGGTSTGTVARDNLGYNPVGVKVVSVPASGSPTTAQVYDQVFYVTAPAGTVSPGVPGATGGTVASVGYNRTFYITTGSGSTSIAMSTGPTVTLTASTLNTILLPAGQTMTVNYANAPTWVVEGTGVTTLAVSSGPTTTCTNSGSVYEVFVPAGQTLTPTYANAPTWLVEAL